MLLHELKTLSICLCAGGLTSVAIADEPLGVLEPSKDNIVNVGHIYFNIATGEKIVSLLSDELFSRNNQSSGPIWSSTVSNTCASEGYTSEYYFAIDDNSLTSMGGPPTSLATAATLSDYGDIRVDTVVDMVHINWVTDHTDVDLDSDGSGDGVEGLGGQWTYWDADNGRAADQCLRAPVITFVFADLPGDLTPAGDGVLASYSADIDLGAGFTSSLTFELGDTDGDPQGAAHHLPMHTVCDCNFDGELDTDLDGDGLFDWGWSVRFFQPGTADLDGDGSIDGDIANSMRPIGVNFGAPEGNAVNNFDGTWTWEIDTTVIDAGTGQEDRFAMYLDGVYVSGFWFGGFECEDLVGYTPPAMFEHQLIGPNAFTLCPTDYNGDGTLNFFDISSFLNLFAAMDQSADYNKDGVFNFFDISAFLGDFNAGCP